MKIYRLLADKQFAYQDLSAYLSYVSKERQEKIARLTSEEIKKSSLLTELLLRYALSKETGLTNDALSLGRTEAGKPYLADSECEFSVTQKKDLFAIAISSHPIGIDAEALLPYKEAIARRFYSAAEQTVLENAEDKTLAFYRIWTEKEAYVKYRGTGFTGEFSSGVDTMEEKLREECMFHSILEQGYLLTTCMARGEVFPEIYDISEKFLIDYYSSL